MLTPKITAYKILKRDKKFDLESRVLSYMKEGWQPLGGVSICVYPKLSRFISTTEYQQAIVKYEQQKPNSI